MSVTKLHWAQTNYTLFLFLQHTTATILVTECLILFFFILWQIWHLWLNGLHVVEQHFVKQKNDILTLT